MNTKHTPDIKKSILYVVHNTTSGYAREDSAMSSVAGVYTDADVADKVRKAVGSGATVTQVELNKVHPGYVNFLQAMGFDTNDLNV